MISTESSIFNATAQQQKSPCSFGVADGAGRSSTCAHPYMSAYALRHIVNKCGARASSPFQGRGLLKPRYEIDFRLPTTNRWSIFIVFPCIMCTQYYANKSRICSVIKVRHRDTTRGVRSTTVVGDLASSAEWTNRRNHDRHHHGHRRCTHAAAIGALTCCDHFGGR